jgi:hypothetical protein
LLGDVNPIVDRLPRKGVAEVAVDLFQLVATPDGRSVDEVPA